MVTRNAFRNYVVMAGVAVLLLGKIGTATAASLEDFNLIIGARGWASTWTTWHVDTVFYNLGPTQTGTAITSDTQMVYTPQVTLAFRSKLLLTMSYLAPETYSFKDPITQQSILGRRKEFDASLGYAVLSGLVVNAGYKQIQQDYGSGTFKWTGPTIGVSGSAPLPYNWALYGTYTFGLFKLKVPGGTSGSPDAAGDTSFDANYSVGELGLAYNIGAGRVLKSIRLSIGYRAQLLSTRGYALQVSDIATGGSIFVYPSERDFTQGPTVGVSTTF